MSDRGGYKNPKTGDWVVISNAFDGDVACLRVDAISTDGATFDRYDYSIAHVGGSVGVVPKHTAHALRPEQIPECGFASHDDGFRPWVQWEAVP